MPSFGRKLIVSDVDEVNSSNVVKVLADALGYHRLNAENSRMLYEYYSGNQPILRRIKDVRPEIMNMCVLNHANEIVSFKVSYLLSNPIVYVGRSTSNVSEQINRLNEYMHIAGKPARDKEIADDFNICGNAYRMVLPNKRMLNEDEAPFEIYTLNPERTFIVYKNGLGEVPLCGVTYVTKENGKERFSVYTPKKYFEIENQSIRVNRPHALGVVPIFEYCNNNARLGSFEIVITLLNAINALASNRIDATEQAVQALMVFENCDIDEETYDAMRAKGAIKIKSADGEQSKVYSVGTELNQADQQVLMDALYDAVIKICGMPAQGNGSTSDSSNNGAAITRNGWYHAEARAKDTELLWDEAEMKMLRLVLRICRDLGAEPLRLFLKDIELKFTRRNYEDLLSKSQTFTTLMSTGYTDITDAYAAAGMFPDSEAAAIRGKEWHEQQKESVAPAVPPTAGPQKMNTDDGGKGNEA